MMHYLRRRMMVWMTWRLAALNKALDQWNTTLRQRALLSRAEYIVEREQIRTQKANLTGKSKDE